jgi:nicotinamidase-related amidase
MQISEFVQALYGGTRPSSNVTGLAGRIIRGTKPADFETLSDDPTRKLVMLMGPDGLQKLIGKTGYEMLIEIGYEKDYIIRKVRDEGCKFKLVVFGEGGPAKFATWGNVVDAVSVVYPDIAPKLRKRLSELQSTTFDAIERVAGFDFSAVDAVGPTDLRYMTTERFRAAAGTLVDARAFLYFTVHLRELYTGNGYTQTANGQRGMMEYIVPNLPLDQLGEYEIVDLDIQLPQTTSNRRRTAMSRKTLPIPNHFDPKKVGDVRKIDYERLAIDATAFAKQYGLKPAAADRTRIALMPIDCQNTFCIPGFELFVGGLSGTGAVDDNRRLCEFIYRNLGSITEINPTLDTHTAMQIFHAMFWVNDKGEHPAPMTMISLADVEKGVWKVNPDITASVAKGNYVGLQSHALHYCRKLTDGGKYLLTIWPYHAMLGGIGHALVPALEEAIFFHTQVRRSQVNYQIKGGNPLTENYSIFKPEVLDTSNGTAIAQKNTRFMESLLTNDVVIIAGQAKSHCVAWTIDDLLTEILAKDPTLAKKVYLLEDCTSPVVVPGIIDFTPMADAAFKRFADAGMHVVSSTTPMDQWPGMPS